jgi:hypothetical protein
MPKTTPPKVERRAGKRVRTGIQLQVQNANEMASVATRDVGMNGLSCHLSAPLSLFTKYRFRLSVPVGDEDKEEIDGEGIVVRVEEVEVDGEIRFETAFFFQHLEKGHYKILDSYLKRMDGKK